MRNKHFLICIGLISFSVSGCNPYGASSTTFTPLTASAITSTSNPTGTKKVSLSWAAGSGVLSGYQVEQSIDNVNFAQIQQLGLVTTTTVSALKANTTYYFRVRAFNLGGESPYTSTAVVNTGT